MAYEFRILEPAEKDIQQLDPLIAKRILKKLQWIAAQENPSSNAVLLHHPAIGDLRFRIGECRAIAILDGK